MDHDKATPQELRWRIAQLELRLAEQERINQDIQTSNIWRATKPLRSILRPLSQLKQRLAVGNAHTRTTPLLSTIGQPKTTWPLTPQPWDPNVSVHACVIDFLWDIGDAENPVDCPSLAISQLAIFEQDAPNASPLVTIDFGAKGNSGPFRVFGFDAPETWGSRTRGKRAQIVLWLPALSGHAFTLKLWGGLQSGGVADGVVKVSVNGKDAQKLTFSSSGEATSAFNVDAPSGAESVPMAPKNVSQLSTSKPMISVIILNYNKPYLTFLAVRALLLAQTELTYEILVLDNGSSPENAAIIDSLNLPIRWLRLNENRYFGEGNNIAAEMANGDALLFLNNDVFVEDDVLDLLHAALRSASAIGAAGPVLKYPDGSLQEVGAFIAKDASVYQRGKGSSGFDVTHLPPVSDVDYISAACLMIDRTRFLQLGGFDFRYDPAYYEDSDLCLRLFAQGLKTVLVRDCSVTHIENATTAAPENAGLADRLTERHRAIFLTRWQDWLKNRTVDNLPQLATFTIQPHDPTEMDALTDSKFNAAFTPYPLTSGGGERYLLSAALTMTSGANAYPSAIVTPTRYSLCRVNTLCRELGLPTGRLRTLALQQTAAGSIERYIHMGNELLPSAPGRGNINVFHCQFPFPEVLSSLALELGLKNLATYDVVVVNSYFTKDAYLRALARVSNVVKDVRVIYPAVRMIDPRETTQAISKEKLILSIGRFCPDGHAKRQDVIVAAFKKLRAAGHLVDWRLVLCGTVPSDPASTAYFDALNYAAEGFDIEFILSPDHAQLAQLYRKAAIYVSATGTEINHSRDFHRCEHFGITVVEAMSANCLTVVAKNGGPAEIVAAMGSGYLFSNARELRQRLLTAAQATEEFHITTDQCKLQKLYSEDTFKTEWEQVWTTL